MSVVTTPPLGEFVHNNNPMHSQRASCSVNPSLSPTAADGWNSNPISRTANLDLQRAGPVSLANSAAHPGNVRNDHVATVAVQAQSGVRADTSANAASNEGGAFTGVNPLRRAGGATGQMDPGLTIRRAESTGSLLLPFATSNPLRGTGTPRRGGGAQASRVRVSSVR